MAADWHVSAAVAHRSSNHTVVVRALRAPRVPAPALCVRTTTAGTMDDEEFEIEQKRAADRANTILQSAIAFADDVIPEGMVVEVFRTFVAKHVDAQLHLLEGGNDYELSATRCGIREVERTRTPMRACVSR